MRRSRWEIVRSILESIDRGIRGKSRLMHATNLDWRIFERYTSYLEQEGYVKYNGKGYEITEKGKGLLKKLKELNEMTLAE